MLSIWQLRWETIPRRPTLKENVLSLPTLRDNPHLLCKGQQKMSMSDKSINSLSFLCEPFSLQKKLTNKFHINTHDFGGTE